jgi:hypothetical protein
MRLKNNEIVMDKSEFLTNSLLAGIACHLLALSEQARSKRLDEISI